MLTYADVCGRMRTYARRLYASRFLHVWAWMTALNGGRMLTYADVCGRMRTYARRLYASRFLHVWAWMTALNNPPGYPPLPHLQVP
jgi:ribosomal protein S14